MQLISVLPEYELCMLPLTLGLKVRSQGQVIHCYSTYRTNCGTLPCESVSKLTSSVDVTCNFFN